MKILPIKNIFFLDLVCIKILNKNNNTKKEHVFTLSIAPKIIVKTGRENSFRFISPNIVFTSDGAETFLLFFESSL